MKRNQFCHFLYILLIGTYLALTNTSSVRTNVLHTFPVISVNAPAGAPLVTNESHHLQYVKNYPVLFIGDSRTVGMKQALQYARYDLSNHEFLAKVGKGYSWLTSQSHAFETLSDTPHILIINLGVNDLGNCRKYQQYYESCIASCWAECPIYIVSVNPVCSPCSSVSNRQIENYNASMLSWIEEKNAQAAAGAFKIQYIDTYTYLQTQGYASNDGLHYSTKTYLSIYNYILEQIKEPIGDGCGYFITTPAPPVENEDPRSF